MKMSLYVSVFCCATSYAIMAQAVCTPAPDCASLGYKMTAADCTGQITVKCPTDTSKVFCKKVTAPRPQAELPILYGDGTVSKEIITEKTPIGVVFDTSSRLAVALTDVKKDGTAGSEKMAWASSSYDIPSLSNCSTSDILTGTRSTPITCGTDGRSNTRLILSCGSSCGSTPAVTAINNYQPSGCTKDFCKRNRWFLPSMRDLQNIYDIKNNLTATLTLLSNSNAVALKDTYYWSSTELSNTYAWHFSMNNGSRGNTFKDDHNPYVRPVIAY